MIIYFYQALSILNIYRDDAVRGLFDIIFTRKKKEFN